MDTTKNIEKSQHFLYFFKLFGKMIECSEDLAIFQNNHFLILQNILKWMECKQSNNKALILIKPTVR